MFPRYSRCELLTDRSIGVLMRHCPHLQVLSLQHCRALGDAALAHIAFSGAALKTLSLSGCTQVSDAGLEALATSERLGESSGPSE